MEVVDIIKDLCAKKGIPISQLESDLGYGNGSVSKSKNMSGERMYQIAQYLGVTVEYLITGKTIDEADKDLLYMIEQKKILVDISKVSQEITDLYSKIAALQGTLSRLKQSYNEIEEKRIDNAKISTINTKEPTPLTEAKEAFPFFFVDEAFPANKKKGK